MANLKEVKLKITGVKKTKQITKAMNMVAASRLRGLQRAMEAFRPYAEKFSEVLGSLSDRAGDKVNSPLLIPRDEVKHIHYILCTSDRGLCGAFNVNLIELMESEIERLATDTDVKVSVSAFGKKGRDWAVRRKDIGLESVHLGVVGTRFGFPVAAKAGQTIIDQFTVGNYDEVHIIYSRFHSMSKQVPTAKKLLPISPIETAGEVQEAGAEQEYMAEHICEPSPQELLNDMLPKNIHIQIYDALMQTSTSEHAARMVAMDNATQACNDLIKDLTRLFNKERQAAITADLMDIVGGAEALKG